MAGLNPALRRPRPSGVRKSGFDNLKMVSPMIEKVETPAG